MTRRFSLPQLVVSARFTTLIQTAFGSAIALNLWVNPSLAGDPFRNSEPHQIGNQTEAAFKAIFQQGNYPAADRYLEQAISKEPRHVQGSSRFSAANNEKPKKRGFWHRLFRG